MGWGVVIGLAKEAIKQDHLPKPRAKMCGSKDLCQTAGTAIFVQLAMSRPSPSS